MGIRFNKHNVQKIIKIKNLRNGTINFYKQILKNPKSYRTMDKPIFLPY